LSKDRKEFQSKFQKSLSIVSIFKVSSVCFGMVPGIDGRLDEAHKQVDIVLEKIGEDHPQAARLSYVRSELEQIQEKFEEN
jgi:hypothetical protein